MAAPRERRSPARVYAGRMSGFGHVQRVYQTREALEVDEVEGYEVTRRRVFYDDILLVTYHEFVGRGFVVVTGLLAAAFGGVAVISGLAGGALTGVVVFVLTGLPFLLALVLRVALRIAAVTAYGRRSRAQVHFWFRKRRARRVFERICRAAREAQRPRAIPA